MSFENWVVIYSSAELHQTELLRLFLLQEDIKAVVMQRGDSARLFPDNYELYVSPNDALKASHLIQKNLQDGSSL